MLCLVRYTRSEGTSSDFLCKYIYIYIQHEVLWLDHTGRCTNLHCSIADVLIGSKPVRNNSSGVSGSALKCITLSLLLYYSMTLWTKDWSLGTLVSRTEESPMSHKKLLGAVRNLR